MGKILTVVLASALAVLSANIDGKWLAEIETQGRNGSGASRTIALDLRSNGSKLTGSISAGRARGLEIRNGKIDGNRISFDTVRRSKQGEQRMTWTGTLSGDELKLERSREGARRGVWLIAKRQG